MKRCALILFTLAALVAWSQSGLRSPSFVAGLNSSGTTVDCHTNLSGLVFGERFENALDKTYTTNGSTYLYQLVNDPRVSCSQYFLRATNCGSGNYLSWTNSQNEAIVYLDFYFRVMIDGFTDGSASKFMELKTTADSALVNFRVTKIGTQLGISVYDTLSSVYTTNNINVGTWYHLQLMWDNTNNKSIWYFNGTLVNSNNPAIALSAGKLAFGRNANYGTTVTNRTTFDFDSITISTNGFAPIEY